jgi:hypothetical protein
MKLRTLLIVTAAMCCVAALCVAQVPKGQPDQIKTHVKYASELDTPFFHSGEGSAGNADLGEDPKKIFTHTAKCITEHQMRHVIRFCDAQLLADGTIELYIHDFTAATNDNLKIKIKDGYFTSQYWTVYVVDKGNENVIWTTKKQDLILNKKNYKKGDTIKGKIEFECLQEVTNSKSGERYPQSISIEGFIKPALK